jgi:hypothetical protein
MSEVIRNASRDRPRRLVSLRREKDDFVVAVQPDNIIALRNADPNALRKACSFLRWEIVSDTSLSLDDLGTVTTWDHKNRSHQRER